MADITGTLITTHLGLSKMYKDIKSELYLKNSHERNFYEMCWIYTFTNISSLNACKYLVYSVTLPLALFWCYFYSLTLPSDTGFDKWHHQIHKQDRHHIHNLGSTCIVQNVPLQGRNSHHCRDQKVWILEKRSHVTVTITGHNCRLSTDLKG